MTPHPPRLRPGRAAGLVFLAALAASAGRAQVIHVPRDVADLQSAIARVGNGGAIELATGTYASPANGFRLGNLGKRFTVRAAAGATAVLDGGGARPILDFANGNRGRGGLVVFDHLVFRNGLATAAGRGPLRLEQAEARFVACRFENNRATGAADGGALRVGPGSRVTLVGSALTGNSAELRGGAVSVYSSRLFVARTRFADNHVDRAPHGKNAPGGALYVLDGAVAVYDSHFEGNGAGYVGGAVYVFGSDSATPGVPTSEVLLARSTFNGNRAQPNPCCPVVGPSEGGALHVENQAALRLQRAFLEGNRAADGGGISSFRGRLELYDSALRGNQAASADGVPRTGGGIVLFSNAGPGPGGQPHRQASLLVRNSLFVGRIGPIGATARSGGCIALAGSTNAAGKARVAADVAASAFVDCDATAVGASGALGGAAFVSLSDLRLADSLVLLSDVLGPNGSGGGIDALPDSRLIVERATFAHDTASFSGGAIAATGSALAVSDSRFFGNEVASSRGIASSRGAALFTRVPSDAASQLSVTGSVRSSLFLEQVGVPWFEIDAERTPVNDLRYDGNAVADGTFGSRIFVSAPTLRDGLTVEALNALVRTRAAAPPTDKSSQPNGRAAFPRRGGALLALPRAGTPGIDVPPQLAYAWAGGSATLDGQGLGARAGLVARPAPGSATLAVDGTGLATTAVGAEQCTSGPVLCLLGGRFRAELRWRSTDGESGVGLASPVAAGRGTFAVATAPTLVTVQLLNQCARNGHFVLTVAGPSARAVKLSILDTWSGDARELEAPANAALGTVTDRTTFAACGLKSPPVS